jgi:hypothetical protein
MDARGVAQKLRRRLRGDDLRGFVHPQAFRIEAMEPQRERNGEERQRDQRYASGAGHGADFFLFVCHWRKAP